MPCPPLPASPAIPRQSFVLRYIGFPDPCVSVRELARWVITALVIATPTCRLRRSKTTIRHGARAGRKLAGADDGQPGGSPGRNRFQIFRNVR